MTSVPVVNGVATKGTLYIHNYGTKAVTGLSFGLKNTSTSSKLKSFLNNLGLNLSNSVLDKQGFYLNNPELCTTLEAGKSCAINFTTPVLAVGDQGNSLVTLDYKENGKSYTTNQVINYQYASLGAINGVNFTGSLIVSGAQGTTSHVVGYMFGGGTSGIKYSNVNLTSTSPTTTISNGFVNGQEVAAGQVIAVEFAVTLQNDQKSFVNVTPSWGSDNLNKNTLITPANSGAILTLNLTPAQNTVNLLFGNVPVLSAPTTSAALINVTNNGNSDSGGGLTVETNNNALTISNGCSGINLQANAANSCSISFSVAGYTPGDATVTFKQNGAPVGTQSVIWTNNTPVPAIYIQPNSSTISFGKNERTPESSTIFTLSNVGKAPLNNANYTPTNNASFATWVEDGSTCNNSLAPNDVCTISGHFIGVDDGEGKLYYKAMGNFNTVSYSFVSSPLSYEVTDAPSLVITPTGVNMTLMANGIESIVQAFIVNNVGTDTAIVNSTTLTTVGGTVVPSMTTNTCGNSIATGGQGCTIIVTYGPAAASLSANESGIASLNIVYHGGTPDLHRTVSNNFNYKLVGNDSTIIVSSPSATNLSGSGTQSNPFLGNPKLDPMQISITYTNPSLNYPLSKFNLNTNSLPYGMMVDSTSTCPTGSAVANIESGTQNSCTLILYLDRSLLTNAASGGSVILNFTTPTATWTTPLGFYSSPGNLVYVSYLQPTITFVLSNNNGSFESTVLTMTAANGNMTTSLNANVSEVKSWLERAPNNLSDNCSLNNSDYSVRCNLLNTSIGSVNYTMPNYLKTGESADIPLMFSVANGGYAYLNPSYLFISSVAVGWTRQVGAPQGSTIGGGVSVDSSGNSYVTGYTSKGISEQTQIGDNDYFIAKYNPSGDLQWSKQIGAAGGLTYGRGISVDGSGNSYVTGYTNKGISGQTQIGNNDYFIAKYNSSGDLQWTKQVGATGGLTYGRGISVDSNGNSYVTGYTNKGISGQTQIGTNDYFITKYNSSGDLQWAKQVGATQGSTQGASISVDSSGNSYVTGPTSVGISGQTQIGNNDYFIAKYNSSGDLQWTKQIGAASGSTNGYGINVDSSGNSYVTGSTNRGISGQTQIGTYDYFIAKYTPNGDLQWTTQVGASGGTTYGYGISVDSSGNSYVTGPTNVGISGQTQIGNNDYFIAMTSRNGS